MLSTTYPEPKDTTLTPGPDAISESFHELGISDSRGQSEAQLEEQLKIDNLFLNKDEDEGTTEELGRAETDKLLAPNASEDEDETTVSERPVTVPYAPFSCRDIRYKSLKDRTAAVNKLNEKKMKYGPRKPVYSTIRATAEVTPTVTAVARQTEARPVLRPSRLKKLMSLTLHPANFTIPPPETAPTIFYSGNYLRPLMESRKRRFENISRQPQSAQYMPYHPSGEGWSGLWFCRNRQCGSGNLSKLNRICRKCFTRYYLLQTEAHHSYR